jgi:hypothetical protein
VSTVIIPKKKPNKEASIGAQSESPRQHNSSRLRRGRDLIEINDGRAISENGRRPVNVEAQLLVFMWCRSVDIGAHHACSPLLQAWFITANVPTVTSTTATRSMTKGLFMGVTSPSRPNRPKFSSFKNEPAVNVLAIRGDCLRICHHPEKDTQRRDYGEIYVPATNRSDFGYVDSAPLCTGSTT